MSSPNDPYASYGIGGAGNLRRASDVRAAHAMLQEIRSNSISEDVGVPERRRSSVIDKMKGVFSKSDDAKEPEMPTEAPVEEESSPTSKRRSIVDKLKFKV